MRELKIGLFLGAGSSVPYQKPTTEQIKKKLIEKYQYSSNEKIEPERYYLHSILKFPIFKDIEHVLQCIKEIDSFFGQGNYGGLYILKEENKFISTDPIRPWPIQDLRNQVRNVKRIIEDEVFENYSWNYSFDDSLSRITSTLFDLIKQYSEDIHVFTTNYDKAIEEYCSNESQKSLCIDGFKEHQYSRKQLWEGKFEDPGLEDLTNVYLYKLHGSLNWKRHTKYGIEKTGEERRSLDPNYIEDLLIYPIVSPKDGIKIEPYKTILDEFSKFMEIADICIVIGFSFRDWEINKIFSGFFDRGKRLVIISPSAYSNLYTNLFNKNPPEEKESISLDRNPEFICSITENKRVFTINQSVSVDTIIDLRELIDKCLKSTLDL